MDDQSTYEEKYTEAFQEHMLGVLIADPSLALQYRTALNHEYFLSQTHSVICKALLIHVDQYKEVPTIDTLEQQIYEIASPDDANACYAVIDDLVQHDLSDAEAVRDRIVDFGKQQALCNAVVESAAKVSKGDRDIRPLIDDAMLIGEDLLNIGVCFKDIIGDRFLRPSLAEGGLRENAIPTGIPHVDRILGGGLCRGELGVMLAPPKRGKTLALVNFGFGAMMDIHGYNVLHYSLEIDEHQVRDRYDARLALNSVSKRAKDPEGFRELMRKRIEKSMHGELMIKRYPTRKARPTDLRAHLLLLRAQGYVPDMVIVDYADIMAPDRRTGDMRHEQAGIYEDLRGMAGEFDYACWTASQGNRNSVEKEVMDMTDFGESFEKAAIMDAGFALCQTADEKAQHKLRFVPVGIREAPDGYYIETRAMRQYSYIEGLAIKDMAFNQVVELDADLNKANDVLSAVTTNDDGTAAIPKPKKKWKGKKIGKKLGKRRSARKIKGPTTKVGG